jgi:hypothetical protein
MKVGNPLDSNDGWGQVALLLLRPARDREQVGDGRQQRLRVAGAEAVAFLPPGRVAGRAMVVPSHVMAQH